MTILHRALGAAVLTALAVGCATAATGTRDDHHTIQRTSHAMAATTEPITGTYTLISEDDAADWAIRSLCTYARCVATAQAIRGNASGPSTEIRVFDHVDGLWLWVAESDGTCRTADGRTVPARVWQTQRLGRQPGGTLTGTATATAVSDECTSHMTRPITLLRTGNLTPGTPAPDPAELTPRYVWPASGLHGKYSYQAVGQETRTTTVSTNCLRTVERCHSLVALHDGSGALTYLPFIYAGGIWVHRGSSGNTVLTLPVDASDPITAVTGQQPTNASTGHPQFVALQRVVYHRPQRGPHPLP